jgi:deoxyribodipyrimidine photo-lyase
MKKYRLSIFIFRRDLRLDDNTGLIKALQMSDLVIPIFIFTPEQISNNKYKSNNCIQFMVESLNDLNNQLKKKRAKLYYFYNKSHIVIDKLIQKVKADAVYLNMDYTPYSVARDLRIASICNKHHIDFNPYEDYLLNPVNSVKNGSGDIYQKFTPYYRNASKIKVAQPDKNAYKNYYTDHIPTTISNNKIKQFYTVNDDVYVHGGRSNGLKILNKIDIFKSYNKNRNDLSLATTRLSAYNKFGCVSIREVYYNIKKELGMKNDLIKQLYWRDFYYTICYFAPNTLTKKTNQNYNKKYSKIPWITWDKATLKQKKLFKAWCDGNTGYPVVDAGMRELKTTGFMHNRARLIVASFLTKLLMWHWLDGEHFFAISLIDYDPCQNNGNWQWSSGSGVDSQPYFRIFNPWAQALDYDHDCMYIKKWIPELLNVDNNHIHKWYEYVDDPLYTKIDYPAPIIDYESSRNNAIVKFKKALSN